MQELGLVAPLVGHVGDGNFHLLLLMDMSDGSDLARAKKGVAELVHLALSMGGTCTGTRNPLVQMCLRSVRPAAAQ